MIRRVLALGSVSLLGATAFAVSGVSHVTANYSNDCSTLSSGNTVVPPGGGPVIVYAGSGRTGSATAAAGVCVQDANHGGAPVGGDLEAGASTSHGVFPVAGGPGAYAVLDGSDGNPTVPTVGGIPGGVLQGYAGVSNYETASANDGQDCGCAGGSNSGGAVGIKGVVTLPVPLIVCGDTSGPAWDANSRDGCFVP